MLLSNTSDEPPKWQHRARAVQYWYFKDNSHVAQGPYYPGVMRDWLQASYICIHMYVHTYEYMAHAYICIQSTTSTARLPFMQI